MSACDQAKGSDVMYDRDYSTDIGGGRFIVSGLGS